MDCQRFRSAMRRRNSWNGKSRNPTSIYAHHSYQNRYETAKQSWGHDSHSCSGYGFGSWLSYFYGPCNTCLSRNARDRRFWRHQFLEVARREEEEEKEKERKEEDRRLKDEEVEKLKVLAIKDLDLHVRSNAFKHYTDKFACTMPGKDMKPVLRRGQEFSVTVTFNRAYKKDQDDLIFILEADEENPGKNLKARFKLDENGTASGETYRQDEGFGARIKKFESQKRLRLAVYIPGDCAVGEWDLKVMTRLRDEEKNFFYKYPQALIILFNPWSSADLVHFTDDKKLLDEYILNDVGSVFRGCSSFMGSTSWTYGQFEEGILDICLGILRKVFGFKMTADMADPIIVSRALSGIIDNREGQGVLMNSWSGDFSGGKAPTDWQSSTAILRQYDKDEEAVKYGQCWVTSHLLTTVCRALGLPCRNVANFNSPRMNDNTCTIDRFYTEDGHWIQSMDSDKISNFHTWNEVWILRPDLPTLEDGTYDGWHVVDATPNKRHYGRFKCGPSPVEAVKRGDLHVGFDTAIAFSKVNTQVVHWVMGPDGEFTKSSEIKTPKIGNKLSTKPPDGKPHRQGLSFCKRDEEHLYRLDLTSNYRYEEGSEKETEAVKRAVRFRPYEKEQYTKLCKKSPDLEVSFDKETQMRMGSELAGTTFVKSVSKKDKEVDSFLSVGTCRHWNQPEDGKRPVKDEFSVKTIASG